MVLTITRIPMVPSTTTPARESLPTLLPLDLPRSLESLASKRELDLLAGESLG